jgi:hypothetical protein
MCGGCRVSVGGKMQFACVDGPEFDAHLVDFAELTDRLSAYREHEKVAWDKLKDHPPSAVGGHPCKLAEVEARLAAESH